MKIRYIEKNFQQDTLDLIDDINTVAEKYTADGLTLTVRQLYYQLVAANKIPNNQRSYKRVVSVTKDGRLNGLISWRAIEDRTRQLSGRNHWNSPVDLLKWAKAGYGINLRTTQPTHVEVWVEKEALAGVVERACYGHDVNWFCCRGYVSISELWKAAEQRFRYEDRPVTIVHLGDHDPSGMDMTRDIWERLDTFEADVRVERIALNMDQVSSLALPPNPAKISDSRAPDYIRQFGASSWELDALSPEKTIALIEDAILKLTDEDAFQLRVDQLEEDRDKIDELIELAE